MENEEKIRMHCDHCGLDIADDEAYEEFIEDEFTGSDGAHYCGYCAYETYKRYHDLVHHMMCSIPLRDSLEEACFERAFKEYMSEIRHTKVEGSWDWSERH